MRTIACDGLLVEHGRVLLIKRGIRPEIGKWAIPGGRIEEHETVEDCLKREFLEETGVPIEPIKLLNVYSNPDRDSRKIIALVYFVKRAAGAEATIPKAGSDAADIQWFDLNQLPELAFDHEAIMNEVKSILSRIGLGPQG